MKIKLSKNQWEKIGKKAGWMIASANKNHRVFDNKKDALKFLSDHALMSVGWKEGNVIMEACYWNGKVYITKGYTDTKNPCPKCGNPDHYILNPSMPIINQCTKCQHMWNPDNSKGSSDV